MPEPYTGATLRLDLDRPVTDEEYFAFCEANRDLKIERTARGAIVIEPPAGMESDYRGAEVIGELRAWTISAKRGRAFGSTLEFMLPDGSALSPDAAWVSNERLAAVSKQDLRRFPSVCPEFVVEVMSPSDRLKAARRTMMSWISNGVDLGWLIDGDARCVYVYRKGREMERVTGERIEGEGLVAGFVLELGEIWEGLRSL